LREYQCHLAEDKYLESLDSYDEVSINTYKDINSLLSDEKELDVIDVDGSEVDDTSTKSNWHKGTLMEAIAAPVLFSMKTA
jgi:hypothetical protein